MLYADSPALHGLSHVVMDEVHFLADRMRGAVWEEVILHLPDEVRLVSLSATVSNAEEFGGWIQTVRGDTTVVVDEHRPVPLWQHVMVGKRLFDLFDYRAGAAAKPAASCCVDPELLRHIAHRREADRLSDWQPRGRGGNRVVGRRIYRPPARPDVIGDAGPRGAAAGDHVRVLPRRLRRRGQAVPALVAAADHRRGTRAHRRGDRPPVRRPRRRRPGRARLLRVAGGAAARSGRPPRRDAAGLPAHRRGAVHRRPGQGRIRHRDTGAGHQHARPHGGARAAGEVQRRAARAADAGGVHPADRSRGPARHRRRGPRGGAVESRRRTRRGRRPGVHPHLPAAQLVRAVVQHDDQPGAPDGPEQAHQLLERSFAQYQADRSVVGLVRGIERGETDARRDRRRTRRARRADPRVRPAARGDLRDGARAVPGVAAAAAQGGQRRAGRAAPRRHHHHHPRPARRAGGGAGIGPRRRRPAAAGADRTPLGGADFVGRLLGRVGNRSARCRCPSGSNTASRGCAATWRRRCGRRPPGWTFRRQGQAQRPADGPRRRPGAGVAAGRSCARTRAHGLPDREAEGPARRALPAHRTRQRADSSRRSPRRPTRWRAPSTGSSGCSPSAASSTRRRRRSHASPTTAGCWPGSTARATCWSPNACAAARGRVWTPPSWRRWSRRCSTSPAATRPARPHGRRGPDRASCAGRCQTRAGCRTSCAPTSSGTGSRRAASPTTASSPPSTAGPPPATWPRRWRRPTRRAPGSPLSAGDFVRWCRQVLDLLDQVRNAAPDSRAAGHRETRHQRHSARRRRC